MRSFGYVGRPLRPHDYTGKQELEQHYRSVGNAAKSPKCEERLQGLRPDTMGLKCCGKDTAVYVVRALSLAQLHQTLLLNTPLDLARNASVVRLENCFFE
eukprot:PhM_4_TR457/c1_g4_i1/m.31259